MSAEVDLHTDSRTVGNAALCELHPESANRLTNSAQAELRQGLCCRWDRTEDLALPEKRLE